MNYKYLIGILIISLLLASCASEIPQELTPIKLKLKWVHQSQFAGNYVAQDNGFYGDVGLGVSMEEFTYENTGIDAVVAGTADYGITGADEVLVARAEGKPIKAIAVMYKINPVCAYTLKSSGIEKPQDFIGKTVGVQRSSDEKDTNVGRLYYTMMSKLNINRSEINEVTIGYDATELLDGTVDVSTGYCINEPYLVIASGQEINTMWIAEYGANMYADVIIATEDTIKNKPEITKKFIMATIKGWKYAIEHNDEAISTVLKYAPDRTVQHETFMLTQSMPLIHTGNSPLGWMEENEWKQAHNILREQEILSEDVDYVAAYTNEFMENFG